MKRLSIKSSEVVVQCWPYFHFLLFFVGLVRAEEAHANCTLSELPNESLHYGPILSDRAQVLGSASTDHYDYVCTSWQSKHLTGGLTTVERSCMRSPLGLIYAIGFRRLFDFIVWIQLIISLLPAMFGSVPSSEDRRTSPIHIKKLVTIKEFL